jgi:L-cysteine:1D-myo-inositol 2-amino-2-deoxy-alpha-D-glucopyranoside ligase
VKTWPQLAIPPINIALPTLTLKSTSGAKSFDNLHQDFRMYVCGITPYDATHLGHAATYLTFDLINRYQILSGKRTLFVENITDIDDPLFERANRDKQSWQELGNSQVALFTGDMTALRILPPKAYVSVTEAMPSIIRAIELLSDKGFTYECSGNIYFKSSTFLKDLPIPYQDAVDIFAERGGDPLTAGKESPLDPILWVAHKAGEPAWESKIGLGRPGWHVECTVIALENLLGPDYLEVSAVKDYEIELQGGGSDLIFPHHFMTAAIGTALTGNIFASSYVHAGMVGLDGEKMSKSKGNLVLVSNLLKAGIDPMVIRYALLDANYAQDRMWNSELLQAADLRISKIRSALSRNEVAPTSSLIAGIATALAEDLNTPKAFELIDMWVDETESGIVGGSVGELSRFLDATLGLAL